MGLPHVPFFFCRTRLEFRPPLRYVWPMASPADRRTTVTDIWLGCLWLLVGAGATLAGYLWWLRDNQAAHPGCHASGDCSYLWFSPWANWLGMPVSALAIIPYVLIFAGTLLLIRPAQEAAGRKLLGLLAAFLLVIVVWFMLLQGVVIKQWCRLCLLSHALSTLSALFVFIWLKKRPPQSANWFPGTAVITGLVLGLAAVAGHSLSGQQGAEETFRAFPSLVNIQRQGPAKIRLFDQDVDLTKDVLLVSGAPDAREVVLLLVDYTCPECRRLHSQIRHVLTANSGRFCEVVLPAPLNPKCNPAVSQQDPLHAQACELAQLACVVSRFKPAALPEFHEWLMTGTEPPALETARQRAQALLPGLDLPVEMTKSENLKPLQLGVQAFRANLTINRIDGLPLIMTEKATYLGSPASIDTLARALR